jgi:hypothetical protein
VISDDELAAAAFARPVRAISLGLRELVAFGFLSLFVTAFSRQRLKAKNVGEPPALL